MYSKWLQITFVQNKKWTVCVVVYFIGWHLWGTRFNNALPLRSSQHDHLRSPPKLLLATCELAPSSTHLSYAHPHENGTVYVSSWLIFYIIKKYDRKCQLNVPHKSDYRATPMLPLGYSEKKLGKFRKCNASMTPIFLHGHLWKECALYSGLYGVLYQDP
jgi:hypothetical protein